MANTYSLKWGMMCIMRFRRCSLRITKNYGGYDIAEDVYGREEVHVEQDFDPAPTSTASVALVHVAHTKRKRSGRSERKPK
jgi:hypothetical protein